MVLPAQAAVLEPLADPSLAVRAVGPALLALYVLVVVGPPRFLDRSPSSGPPSAPAAAAVAVGGLLVAVAGVVVPVVALGVPRAAVGVPATVPTPVTVVVLGLFAGIVLHYLAGILKPLVHTLVPDPPASAGEGDGEGFAMRRVAVVLTPVTAARDTLLACGAVAATVAGVGVPPVGAAVVVVAVRTVAAATLSPTPSVKVADRTLAEVGVLAVFLLTADLFLAVAAHVGYGLYTQYQIQRYVVERYEPGAGG